MSESNKQIILDRQWEELSSLAVQKIRPEKNYGVVTPWVDNFFPWNFIRKSPLLYSTLIPMFLYLGVLIANFDQLDVTYAWKLAVPCISIFFGLYVVYIAKNEYEKIFLDLSEIVTTEKSTFGRWYADSTAPLWGRVNLLDPDKREGYLFRDLLKNDWLILFQFVFWTFFNGTIAFLVTRDSNLPVVPSIGWFLTAVVAYFWAFSFMWTSHYIPASIIFLSKLKRLPVRYSFHIPDSMTLKRVGGRLVKLNWVFSLHYLGLLLILTSWGAFEVREESPVFTAAIALFMLVGVVLYLVWISMAVVLPQVALSASMASYKQRFISEFYRHIENAGLDFMHTPNADNYEALQEKAKYKTMFKQLPVLSLSRGDAFSFLCLVSFNVGMLAFFFFTTVGGWENLMNLLEPIL